MRKESVTEREVCIIAGAKGWLVFPKFGLHSRGWPDRVFSKTENGVTRLMFVEFKAWRKKLSPLQARIHEELRKEGYDVHVIDSTKDAIKLLS